MESKMLLDNIAKLAGKTVKVVTQTVGTVVETAYKEVSSVPSAFMQGLTDGRNYVKKEPLYDEEPTETGVVSSQYEDELKNSSKSVFEKSAENNKSIFKK
jgi:hypothetical protein